MKDESLQHYGVLGMKWGIHNSARNIKKTVSKINNTNDKNERKKYQAELAGQHVANSKRLVKINDSTNKLQRKKDKYDQKLSVKAAKYKQKASKFRSKSFSKFKSEEKKSEYVAKAEKYEAKANKIQSKVNVIKAKLSRDDNFRNKLNTLISEADNAAIAYGKKRYKRYITEIENNVYTES